MKADATHAFLFPSCRALVDRTQGKNVFAADYFTQCVSNADQFLLLALLEGEVIGVASARCLPADGAAYYKPFGNEALQLFQHHRVRSMNALRFRNHGRVAESGAN